MDRFDQDLEREVEGEREKERESAKSSRGSRDRSTVVAPIVTPGFFLRLQREKVDTGARGVRESGVATPPTGRAR